MFLKVHGTWTGRVGKGTLVWDGAVSCPGEHPVTPRWAPAGSTKDAGGHRWRRRKGVREPRWLSPQSKESTKKKVRSEDKYLKVG